MEAIRSFVAAIPSPVTATFAAIGALFLGSKLFSYLGFLLNIFLLRGTNVSLVRQQLLSTFMY